MLVVQSYFLLQTQVFLIDSLWVSHLLFHNLPSFIRTLHCLERILIMVFSKIVKTTMDCIPSAIYTISFFQLSKFYLLNCFWISIQYFLSTKINSYHSTITFDVIIIQQHPVVYSSPFPVVNYLICLWQVLLESMGWS